MGRILALHLGLLAGLMAIEPLLAPFHQVNMARVMVLACFAMGYNILFGYTGLLSLGHALFFAAGVYGTGLSITQWGWGAEAAFLAGLAAGGALAALAGLLALRTVGVGFMIVTLMFAQAGFLTILWFGPVTRGDEGFILPAAARMVLGADLAQPWPRYLAAWSLFAVCLLAKLALVLSPAGRVLVAIRENEERARLLGYDPFARKLGAMAVSGLYAGAAGAAYALLFGYVGATFASVQYSIFALLYCLLGGVGVALGPFVGALAMFYLVEITSGLTDAYMLLVGLALIGLILFAPRGVMGLVRDRARWLP